MKNRKIILIIVFIISLILIGIGIFLSLKGEYNTKNENNEVDNGEVIVDYNINYYNSVDEAINYIKAIRNTENVNIINEDENNYYIEVSVNNSTFNYVYSKVDNTLSEE
ncbi:MAG: hypothetical protein PUG33_06730 [Mollicutes bacterium]|nr:hypothetical protein [Mollicutes bacterium]MDY5875073.1 hypothetical protein [Bacilli bacterium]